MLSVQTQMQNFDRDEPGFGGGGVPPRDFARQVYSPEILSQFLRPMRGGKGN